MAEPVLSASGPCLDRHPFPFAYGDVRLFWAARIAAMLAQSGMVLSIGWQVYDVARLTMGVKEAAFRLGLIGLFQFLPVLLLTPVSGLVADRMDRRLVACASLMVQWAGARCWRRCWRCLWAGLGLCAGGWDAGGGAVVAPVSRTAGGAAL
jgi:hypothetical protein